MTRDPKVLELPDEPIISQALDGPVVADQTEPTPNPRNRDESMPVTTTVTAPPVGTPEICQLAAVVASCNSDQMWGF